MRHSQANVAGVAAGKLADVNGVVCVPCDPGGGGRAGGGEYSRLAAGGGDTQGDLPNVATGYALVAHQAADECDGFAVGRPSRKSNLQAVERAGDIGRTENSSGFRVRDIPGPRFGTWGTLVLCGR